MKKLFCAALFCASFFSYAAEKSNSIPITRGRGLGDTGSEGVSQSPDFAKRRTSSSPRFSPKFLQEENLKVTHDGRLSPAGQKDSTKS
jgi:hypothetical protein